METLIIMRPAKKHSLYWTSESLLIYLPVNVAWFHNSFIFNNLSLWKTWKNYWCDVSHKNTFVFNFAKAFQSSDPETASVRARVWWWLFNDWLIDWLYPLVCLFHNLMTFSVWQKSLQLITSKVETQNQKICLGGSIINLSCSDTSVCTHFDYTTCDYLKFHLFQWAVFSNIAAWEHT